MAQINPPDKNDPVVHFSSNLLMLERARVAARGKIGGQVLHDMTLSRYESPEDFMLDTLTIELSTHVLRHKVQEQDRTVPFSKTVHVKDDTTLISEASVAVWSLWTAGAILFGIGAFLFTWAILAGFVLTSIAFIASAAPRKDHVRYDKDVTVSGEVEIKVRDFNTFPENNTVYPGSLGEPVRIRELTTDVRYDDGR